MSLDVTLTDASGAVVYAANITHNLNKMAAEAGISAAVVRGSVAEQCRALGLEVGDTIEGTEGGHGWWNTTRLTLLWLGDTAAAWRVTDRSSSRPDWSQPREAANWTLSCRDWRKVGA